MSTRCCRRKECTGLAGGRARRCWHRRSPYSGNGAGRGGTCCSRRTGRIRTSRGRAGICSDRRRGSSALCRGCVCRSLRSSCRRTARTGSAGIRAHRNLRWGRSHPSVRMNASTLGKVLGIFEDSTNVPLPPHPSLQWEACFPCSHSPFPPQGLQRSGLRPCSHRALPSHSGHRDGRRP